jgi:hypothetical protein
MDDTRERFLQAIVGRLGAERIVELHLFSPIRQGVMETGVAVVAALPDLEPPGAGEVEAEVVSITEPTADDPLVPADSAAPLPVNHTLHHTLPLPQHHDDDPEVVTGVETPAESRHVVFTAGYRLTRKGPDRGKWFFELAATADAPLATVDMVVRGVMHRSKDLTESERLSGDQLRALLAQPAWRTTP